MPVIAIVGRPNVGKSALFNKLVGRRISIVHEQSGVTRDRVAAPVLRDNRRFLLIDTGGLGVMPQQTKNVEMFDRLIRCQVEAVMEEAGVLLWVVDAQTGPTDLDAEVAAFLRQTGLPVSLVINKSDNKNLYEESEAAFAKFGFSSVFSTSCTHNAGIRELLNHCLEFGREVTAEENTIEQNEGGLRLAVVGRPNVGKSSLVNGLLGEERVLVSDVAGTTRDAIDVPIKIQEDGQNVPLTFIDTAGFRKKSRIGSVVEYFSVMRSQNAIKRCDIVLLVLDATEPGSAQDRHIIRLIQEERKPCIVIVNKWDLLRNTKLKDFEEKVKGFIPFISYAPMVTISAKTGEKIDEVFEAVLKMRSQMHTSIPTSMLNQFLQDTIARTPPPAINGKFFKMMYATMAEADTPRFIVFVNNPKLCTPQYRTFLEKQLRGAFFAGSGLPIQLIMRARRRPEEGQQGNRRAISGIMRQKIEKKQASSRHNERRKGYRKK
jgi:GTP-binding protein